MTIARKTGGRPSKRPTNAELAMLYSVMTAKGIVLKLTQTNRKI